MAESDSKRVSMMAQETTPAGNQFGILRNAKDTAAQLRGQALDKCVDIVTKRAPELLRHLKSNASAEYMMSSALMNAEDLGVKADLARVIIQEDLDEGHYYGAVQMLTYGGVEQTELPEFQNWDFLGELFTKAQQEGDLSIAWMVADEVTKLQEKGKIDQVVKYPTKDERWAEGWKAREQNAFEAYAKEVLATADQYEDIRDNWELDLLFQTFRFRDEGYGAEQPSKLAHDVAKTYCTKLAENPQQVWRAMIHAAEANLPQVFIEELEDKLPLGDRTSKKVERFVANTISHFQILLGSKK